MKFLDGWSVAQKWLDFGGDKDHDPEPGSVSWSVSRGFLKDSLFTIVIPIDSQE